MTDEHDRTLDRLYDQLGEEFGRVARAESSPRARWRKHKLLVPLAVIVLGGGTAGLALAGQLSSEEPSLEEPSMISVPAPLFAPDGDCPVEVRDALLGLERLSDYPQTPGYPVSGCPTLEELRQNEAFVAEFNALKNR